MNLTTTTRSAALGAATALALAAAPPAASADGYQFIVSGDPNSDTPAFRDVSNVTALATGALRDTSDVSSLEARNRTIDKSDGVAFRSDKFTGFFIIMR